MLEKLQNIVYDTNYTTIVPNGGFVVLPKNTPQSSGEAPDPEKKNSMAWMDSLLQKLGLAQAPKKP